MFQVPSFVVLLGLTLCILPSHKTMAQQSNESDVVYEAARNKIGLIRYCRNVGLLDPAIADQAVTAVEAGLRELASSETFASEQGDRAQQAGEDGFWEAGRRRDIAGIATLFRTTPADLCQEWAGETVRAQALKPYREVKTITMVVPKPFQPIWQAGPAPVAEPAPVVEPIQVDRPPAQAAAPAPVAEPIQVGRPPAQAAAPAPVVEPTQVGRPFAQASAVVRVARPNPPPPLPEKAPFPPAGVELASFQPALPTGGQPAPTDRAVSGQMNSTTVVITSAMPIMPSAIPQSSGQAKPLSARLATEAAEPLPREQTVAAAEPLPREQTVTAAEPSRRLWARWPFNRMGKPGRCLMPGCKWSAPEEKRASQY